MSAVEQSSEIPLPPNWTIRLTADGKKVFVDHANKITTWIDPRDSLTKPQSFADCIGNELPYGWEVAYDENIGQYFINHNDGSNQLEDPRIQWRMLQEAMIRDYLKSAQENISAKENILQLKHERLTLAEQELSNLNHILQRINEKQQQQQQNQLVILTSSKTSPSSSSSLSSKYDPDLLRAEIETARQRVAKLKMEEQFARYDLRDKQRGVQTLKRIKQKMIEKPEGYTLSERNALEHELINLKQTLTTTDEEKINLLRALAKLREDIQGMEQKQLMRSTELPNALLPTEKATSSSQTDAVETMNGNRVAAVARARLKYNELKCLLNQLQEQLMALNERMLPSQLELDRDQLNLIREKENLLRELKTVCQSDAPFDQQSKLTEKMHELEEDLRQALCLTREEMTHRLHMHQQKANLELQIHETGLALANLERQLRSLSASTLSTSSLSTNSSHGSLASGSAQDLLYMTNTAGEWSPYTVVPSEFKDVHRRVEQLVYPQQLMKPQEETILRPNVAHLSSPPPYDVTKFPITTLSSLDPSSLIMRLSTVSGGQDVRQNIINNPDVVLLRENSASSGTNTRSVSAAVSDESVAGDSGVYDGNNQRQSGGVAAIVPAVAQLLVTLDYAANVNKLRVTLERARNLNTLWQTTSKQITAVQIRGSLLPTAPGEEFTFRTDWCAETEKPAFRKTFELNINLPRICNKILQLYVWGERRYSPNDAVAADGFQAAADCLGGTQINLAEFNSQMMRSQWTNILSSQFIKLPPSEPPSDNNHWKNHQNTQVSRHLNTLKEESSDESTVISSQTSTLTRNPNQAPIEESKLEQYNEFSESNLSNDYRLRVVVNDDTTSDDDDDIANEELVRVEPTSVQVETCDKETNTEPLENNSNVPSTVGKSASVANAFMRPRKLNRSDSDSSVALQRKEPFRRNVVERRSLRWKRLAQPVVGQHRHASSAINSQDAKAVYHTHIEHHDHFRTSVDIELDLQTTKFKLERQKEEIETLRKMKFQLEKLKAEGRSELPKWMSDNEGLIKVLNASESSADSSMKPMSAKETEEKRARRIVRKAAHHVQKLNEVKHQQPSTTGFYKKIISLIWTSPSVVSVINVNEDATDNSTDETNKE